MNDGDILGWLFSRATKFADGAKRELVEIFMTWQHSLQHTRELTHNGISVNFQWNKLYGSPKNPQNLQPLKKEHTTVAILKTFAILKFTQ